jgi:uncharacterized membrane protein
MITDWFSIALWLAALGTALMAGVFFAFSTFVMAGLGQLPPPAGISAMQAINRTAVRPAFMTLFLGTTVACVAVIVGGFARWGAQGAAYALLGGVAYVAGSFVVTVAANVPRNDALARVDPASPEGAKIWERYLSGWTGWNHVRTFASSGAAVALIVALVQMRP